MSATLESPPVSNSKFDSLDWPIRTIENWRFGAWKEANLSGLEKVGSGTSGELPAEVEGFTRLVFENGKLVSGSHPQVSELTKSFSPESKLGSPKLAALHEEQADHGVKISASGEDAIEIIHFVSGEGLLLPSLVIDAAAGSNVRVIERFISVGNEATTVVSAVDVNLGDKAEVKYLVTQELNLASKLIRFADSVLKGASTATQAVIHSGAKWVREETHSTVDGSDGKSHILSVGLPGTGQEVDQRTFQHHGARDTYSDLLFKNTLFGKGKTIFSGLIFVDEGAHGTDAYQTNRNLLMTDDCEAHSMPGLEINADDVKCSHGTTNSRVSDEEIFYLQARGIDPKKARSLVALGFSVGAVEKLEDETLEALALEVIERKFDAVD